MSFLPLILSVKLRADDRVRQKGGSCQFCGYEAAAWREFPLGMSDRGEGARSCALCHLAQHLDRPEIEREAVLIWLPQITQAALNRVVWRFYSILAEHRVGFDRRRPDGVKPEEAAGAVSLRLELKSLAALAEREVGTSSPAELSEAFYAMSPEAYALRARRLAGLRLLGLGRFYEEGRDIFPEFIGGSRGCSI